MKASSIEVRLTLVFCSVNLLTGGAHLAHAADLVTKWNAIAAQNMSGPNPLPHLREFSILHVAMYDALVSLTRDYQPYRFTIRADKDGSPEAAAITAARDVLSAFHPANAATLDAQYTADLSAIADGSPKEEGIRVGHEVAAAVLAARTADGYSAPAPDVADGTVPYQWRRTPPNLAEPLMPQFAAVTPWAIRNPAQFLPKPPPALTGRRYARDLNEVKTVGSSSSSEKKDLALFHLMSHSLFWNDVARQLCEEDPGTLLRTARIFAAMNTAMMDSYIGAWHAKWNVYFNWRPITAIRLADTDDNSRTVADMGWLAYGVTPPHPTYPSGHGAGSGSAAHILKLFFGNYGHLLDVTSPTAPGVTLHYSRLSDIESDVQDARVYLGIHFRFDTEAGEKLGEQTARFITRTAFQKRGRSNDDDDICAWEP